MKRTQLSLLILMAEARKIETRRKKFNLKTFGDAVLNIWETCCTTGKCVKRIDIVFDCYAKDSIKSLERERRSISADSMRMIIENIDQPLPIASEFARFWSSSENKIALQQFFITWLVQHHNDVIPVYLGGCHVADKNICYKLVNGKLTDVPALKSSYDEADDRLIYHLNHAVRTDNISCAHVVSSDTDIFVSLMYHILTWSRYGLQEVWTHHGGSVNPVHESVSNLPVEVTRILPAIHALSGCDTTSKIGTKLQAYSAANNPEHYCLKYFGLEALDDNLFKDAEKFLLQCLPQKESKNVASFDELRYQLHHKHVSSLPIDKFPCTTRSVKTHIQRSYYQCNLWLCAATEPGPRLNPIDFGYSMDENEYLYPDIRIEPSIPPDFPNPCKCEKCAREKVCPCRVLKIPC